MGILHQLTFRRVVLDEAQHIKNGGSQTSKACRALKAKFRWAISGTPIQNGYFEAYSYLSFLKMPGITDSRAFNKEFKNDQSRLKELLSTFLIRRTYKTKILNDRIIDIPPHKRNQPTVQLSGVELVYEQKVTEWIKKMIAMMKDSVVDPGERQKRILMIFIRTRQIDSHWSLAIHFLPFFGNSDLLRRLIREQAVFPLSEHQLDISFNYINNFARQARAQVKRITEQRKADVAEDSELLESLVSGTTQGPQDDTRAQLEAAALEKPFKIEKFSSKSCTPNAMELY